VAVVAEVVAVVECWNCEADLDEHPPRHFRRETGVPISYCCICEAKDPWEVSV